MPRIWFEASIGAHLVGMAEGNAAAQAEIELRQAAVQVLFVPTISRSRWARLRVPWV